MGLFVILFAVGEELFCNNSLSVVCASDNGKRATVIGSGPASVTAAVVLAENGYSVTILERKNNIGSALKIDNLFRDSYRICWHRSMSPENAQY